jgi:hypothetical protein
MFNGKSMKRISERGHLVRELKEPVTVFGLRTWKHADKMSALLVSREPNGRFTRRISCLLLAFVLTPRIHAEVIESDICVYGGTSAGVIAAVQGEKWGSALSSRKFGKHLGGLTSGGLTYTDIGNKAAVGGISREFYRTLGKHYGKEEAWTFEPSVAEREFNRLAEAANVPVHLQQRLGSVKKDGAHITEITMENGNVFAPKCSSTASYEGDLMAKAGVSYHVGRRRTQSYGETLNGICRETPKHQFLVPVDPYVKPGNPGSGLLPLIQNTPFGNPGDGDRSVQAYNFRLCFTKNAGEPKTHRAAAELRSGEIRTARPLLRCAQAGEQKSHAEQFPQDRHGHEGEDRHQQQRRVLDRLHRNESQLPRR